MEPKSAAVSTVPVSVRKDSPFRISISFCSSASSSACLLLDTSLIMSQLDSSSESLSQELSDRSLIVVKVTSSQGKFVWSSSWPSEDDASSFLRGSIVLLELAFEKLYVDLSKFSGLRECSSA